VSNNTVRGAVSYREKEKSKGGEKAFRWTLLILSVLLLSELIWFFGVTPCMPLSSIEIETIEGLAQEDAARIAGLSEKSSFFSINPSVVQKALEAHYLVETAQVSRRFPDLLRIKLSPRKAAAISFADYQGRQAPVFIDRHGIVFKIGASSPEYAALSGELPILSGLVFENLSPGTKLPEAFVPLLENIDNLRHSEPGLFSSISEIRVQKKPYDGFDILLYPVNCPIRFRTGTEFNAETIRYMVLVSNVFKRLGIETGEIDFRTGTASYKLKEASTG
jgi:cell division protein FtsQ